MRGYLYYATMRWRTVVAYKSDAIFRIIRGIVEFITLVYVWKALYNGADAVAGTTILQMVTYVVISRLVSNVTYTNISYELDQRLKSGEIATDLIRPMNIRMLFAARSMGDALAAFLLEGLPVTIFSIVYLRGILPPSSIVHFLLFIISVALAVIVNIMIQLLMGVLAFWYMNSGKINMLMGALNALLSGSVVPLWFMPKWMSYLAYALPLQAVSFTPVQIYLGKLQIADCLQAVLLQIAWIFILLGIQSLLWKKALKRIVVFGG